MKRFLSVVFFVATTNSFSQSIFPSLSPKARIEQQIGSTVITIDYERPAARGRKVFGELVPYEKLWRTGAGNCTKVRFTRAVMIDGKKIAKGTYSLFAIPTASEWTVILNTDTTLYGTGSYAQKKDAIRFKVESQSTDRYYESLTIDIDVIPNNARMYIAWEKTQISFPVETESDGIVDDFVRASLLTDKSNDPDEYATAAEYYYYLGRDLDRALLLINKAIARRNESWYYRQKIDILEKQSKDKEAIECANLAIATGNNRTDWDSRTKQQHEAEYKKRIEFFQSRLKR